MDSHLSVGENRSANSSRLNYSFQSDQSVSLGLIATKLGHELEEIRMRSLDNLISKIDNNLLGEDELAANKELFFKLFELFNYKDFTQQEKLIGLLLKLSKMKSTARTIVFVNGLNVLNGLKSQCKESKSKKELQLIVDQLMDNLAELGSSSVAGEATNSCRRSVSVDSNSSANDFDRIHKSLTDFLAASTSHTPQLPQTINDDSTNSEKTLKLSRASSSINDNDFEHSKNQSNFNESKQQNQVNQKSQNSSTMSKSNQSFKSTHQVDENISNLSQASNGANLAASTSSMSSSLFSSSAFQKSIPVSTSELTLIPRDDTYNNHNNYKETHSNTNTHRTSESQLRQKVHSSKEMDKKHNEPMQTIYYWLPLTQMDKQFLNTAENSLKSDDAKKIKSYCTFLQTIVFNDFHAEIFLQRSTILKILIDLICKHTNESEFGLHSSTGASEARESDYTHEDSSLLKSLISCFHYYCIKLKKRISYLKDPSTFCNKEFYSNGFNFLSKTTQMNTNISTTTSKNDRGENYVNHVKSSNKAARDTNNGLNTSLYSIDNSIASSALSSIKSSISSKSNKSTTANKSAKTNAPKSFNSEVNQERDDVDCPRVDESLHCDFQSSIDSLLCETNMENYETDLNEKVFIQKSQEWPIHAFCFKLIETLLDNLSLIMVKNNSKANSSSNAKTHQTSSSLISLICDTVNCLMDILHETRQEWCKYNPNEILVNFLLKLNLNLKYLHSRTNEQLSGNKHLNILNHIVYIYYVVTLNKTLTLINSIDQLTLEVPYELTEMIFLMLNDVCLIESFRPIQSQLAHMLRDLDPTLYEIYKLSNEICESMSCACDFLMKYDQTNIRTELVEIAKKSLNYMDYHLCLELAGKIVEFCSKICLNVEKENEKIKSDVEYLVTSCMMSKSNEIRLETYSKISKIVNESLNVQVATEINSKRYKGINFLLLNKIFYQFITFGLFDKSPQVRKLCQGILSHLLQCELLIPESFRQKLTQLIAIYMPFIQCFASVTDPMGQCILNMSDEHLTPSNTNNSHKLIEDGLKLFLTPAIERLRSSLRYLYSKDKTLRKKGYMQSIGFLTKFNQQQHQQQLANSANVDETLGFFDDETALVDVNNKNLAFSLNEFNSKYLPEKFAEIATRLKKQNRTFLPNNYTVSNNEHTVYLFQTDNLLKIYNIFTSETIDVDLRQNAGEQLAIMLSTGDQRLHRAFINLDGVNYCLRHLKNCILKSHLKKRPHLFLSNIDQEKLDRIEFSCLSCICNVFYWNKDVRQLYIFDVDLYRMIFKCLLLSYNYQLKYQAESAISSSSTGSTNAAEAILYANCQEDLSILLFMILFNHVSCLDYYHNDSDSIGRQTSANKFDLSSNLKEQLIVPFNMNPSNSSAAPFELKHLQKQQERVYECTYKLNSSLSAKLDNYQKQKGLFAGQSKNEPIDARLKQTLDEKFRLHWNFKWHGGSLLKLCNDLLYNEQFVHNSADSNFSESLCLRETDKFLVKYTAPVFLYKQLCNELSTCSTHQEALLILDMLQIVTSILDAGKFRILTDNLTLDRRLVNDDYDVEFYAKNSLHYYFNRFKCDWHLSLNRFSSTVPSNKSRLDQILFCSSFKTIARMLGLQAKLFDDKPIDTMQQQHSPDIDIEQQPHIRVDSGGLFVNGQFRRARCEQEASNDEKVDQLLLIDKWLFSMIYNPSSCLLSMVKHFLANYETDESRINSYLLSLCEFIKTYFDRLCNSKAVNASNMVAFGGSGGGIPSSVMNEMSLIEQFKVPSLELLKICIEQMQACEVEKFRNLNKLSILINLIGSLLSVSNRKSGAMFGASNATPSTGSSQNSCVLLTSFSSAQNHNKLFVQLIKSLVQIINIFNIGRGGLSLSFMGNFITKSAHTSLLQLVRSVLVNSDNQQKADIVKAVLCLRDHKNNLVGSSWLVPLLLHREPQIRSISFCLISLLINIPYGRIKLLTNQTGIWNITLNVLLNRYESSIVRTQACTFLVNLTQSLGSTSADDESCDTSISITCLQLLLNEVNFYNQIAFTLTSFYPYETYSLVDLINEDSQKMDNNEVSICSPLLVNSICQLLYNLTVLFEKEAVLMANHNGIISLLVSYVKPMNLFSLKADPNDNKRSSSRLNLNDDLVKMLMAICKYLNLCCQIDPNCVFMFVSGQNSGGSIQSSNNNNLIYDLIECLGISHSANVDKCRLEPLFAIIFDLLSTFLSTNEEKHLTESCLFRISKCWTTITSFLTNDLLADERLFAENDHDDDMLLTSALKFYSIYLSKLTQLINSNENSSTNNQQILFENITYLFDSLDGDDQCHADSDHSNMSFGALLCTKLIKLFDTYFLVDTNPTMKQIVANLMNGLFSISQTAKQVAVNSGLIETLIEHLKYTHSKVNLKSLGVSGKGPLKDSALMNDMQSTLYIIKYLMCNNLEIKESVTKNGLIGVIHSFWCWALQDQNVLKASLSTLCTLTANNKLAVNAISQSNVTAQTVNALAETRIQPAQSLKTTAHNGLSLFHSIVKSLQKSLMYQQAKPSLIVQKYSFSILTNCAQSNECKNIIWKSNLLQDFTANDIQIMKTNFTKFNLKLEKFWLNFLLGLSFNQDGQQLFMKVESLLSTIIKLFEYYQQHVQSQPFASNQQLVDIQYVCLLILRNLAFNQSNKSKLISNADYVNLILQSLRIKIEKFQMLSLSALDSLLYDYQKAKIILKNANALKFLVEIYEQYSKAKNKNNRILTIINDLIKLLNES